MPKRNSPPQNETDLQPDSRLEFGDKIFIARRAEALLKDPLLSKVFDDVAAFYRNQWENAPRGSFELQQTAHLSLCALKDVRAHLVKYLNAGKLEAAIQDQKRADNQTR